MQNRFYSGGIKPASTAAYSWTWYVNLEATPPGGANIKPRLTIQHFDTATFGYSNAWGIELTATGTNLIVTGIGGPAASVALSGPLPLGAWTKLSLSADFSAHTVSAALNDGPLVSLPISLVATGRSNDFRFCYRGEGLGNTNTMLLDDVAVAIVPAPPACPNAQGGCDRSDIFPAGAGDCVVDLSDLGVVLANFEPGVAGKTRAQGDIFPGGAGDGFVDLSDLGQVLADFGTDCR